MQEDTKTTLESSTPNDSTKEGNEGGKVFTQSEVDKILSERLAREKEATKKELTNLKTEYDSKIQDTVKQALEEERRLSKLNAEEKEKEMLERQAKENAEKERNLTIRENTLIATDKLVESGIQPEKARALAKFLVNEKLEVQEQNVQDFLTLYNETVAVGVEQKMAGNPPKDVSPKSEVPTKEFRPTTFI